MSETTFGRAILVGTPTVQEPGVSFVMPYGDKNYEVTLRDEEVETIFDDGLESKLGRISYLGLVRRVTLDYPNEEALVRAGAIRIDAGLGSSINVEMDICVSTNVTNSDKVHMGILHVERATREPEWTYRGYVHQPPLKHLPEFEPLHDR